MSRNFAPLDQSIVSEAGDLSPEWLLYFDSLDKGDAGNNWTPELVGLTGTVTTTGRFYEISSNLVYFRAEITPSGSMSSVAGTTYINNFPKTINGGGACLAIGQTSGIGVGLGVADSDSGRVYMPAWSGVTVTITIVGLLEAR